MLKTSFKIFSLLIYIYCTLCISLAYYQFSDHWSVNFMLMTIPFALFGLVLLLILQIFTIPKWSIISILFLIWSFPLMKRTFQISIFSNEKSKDNFSLLSYNTMNYLHDESHEIENANKLIKWDADFNADIKCFQEFNYGDTLLRYNTIQDIAKNNKYSAFSEQDQLNVYGYCGLAIFSKYPIISKKDSIFSTNKNGFIRADIVIKNDTLRVINIHLWSMNVRVDTLIRDVKTKNIAKATKSGKLILNKLKVGFEERENELKIIEKEITTSPYPVILCGDFNEIPYCNAYNLASKYLKNSFEQAGNGFGFTLNIKPRFIRIDYQFFSKNIGIHSFETLRNVNYSDHFPLYGIYSIK